jgi:hypothetical protein
MTEPFVAIARNFLDTPGSLSGHKKLPEMKETVRYMLDHAVGIDHAVSTKTIVQHLKSKDFHVVDERDWQITVLGPLRVSGIFIASKRAKGMFIIKDDNDAKIAISQIQTRIDTQTERLNILKDECRKFGLKID